MIFRSHVGPRICIGKPFALMQLKVAIAGLVNAYRFELVDCARNGEMTALTGLL